MSGFFKVKSKHRLSELEIGARLEESDFGSITPDGMFVQLEYVEETTKRTAYKVKPGIWSIQKSNDGMFLETTSFVNDKIMMEFVYTKEITDRIDCFFKRLHIYKKHNIEIPTRKLLLYGPAGGGKSTIAMASCNKYVTDGKTAVVLWDTDKIDAIEVKEFFKTFEYIEGVEKVILVMEDIGGVEIDQVRIKSASSLLALLVNQEKTFKIPTFIIGTTNHPENFLGNLTNRPGRFDDKFEVGFPNGASRRGLLLFFLGEEYKGHDVLEMIAHKKYEEFTPAHLREVVIRSDLYDLGLCDAVQQIYKEIELYKKAFDKNKGRFGIINEEDDY